MSIYVRLPAQRTHNSHHTTVISLIQRSNAVLGDLMDRLQSDYSDRMCVVQTLISTGIGTSIRYIHLRHIRSMLLIESLAALSRTAQMLISSSAITPWNWETTRLWSGPPFLSSQVARCIGPSHRVRPEPDYRKQRYRGERIADP